MKIALFGCGHIANRVAKSLKLCKDIDFVGFGSKSLDKAQEYAKLYDCKSFGDYDYFLSDSSIDAIYIATYNINHYELIKQCLNAKKHVICEKPMIYSLDKLDELFKLAKDNNVILMEALKSVFLPLNIKIKQMLKDEVIGKTLEIKASFAHDGKHPSDHWIQDPITGGAAKDLGTYTVGTMNFLMDSVPKIINFETNRTPDHSDTTTTIVLDYDGVKAIAINSNDTQAENMFEIKGTKGFIHVENFWKTGEGYFEVFGKRYELHEELISDFYYELEHFAHLVDTNASESDVMSYEASKNILKVTTNDGKY